MKCFICRLPPIISEQNYHPVISNNKTLVSGGILSSILTIFHTHIAHFEGRSFQIIWPRYPHNS